MLVKMPKGFTLIELMIVLVILGIMAVMVAPANMTEGGRVTSAATDIHMSLLRARSEAIKRNTNVTVTAMGSWKNGWNTNFMIETHGALSGSKLEITGPASVTFTPSGRATANPIKISITSTATSIARCISVNLSGQAIITKQACT